MNKLFGILLVSFFAVLLLSVGVIAGSDVFIDEPGAFDRVGLTLQPENQVSMPWQWVKYTLIVRDNHEPGICNEDSGCDERKFGYWINFEGDKVTQSYFRTRMVTMHAGEVEEVEFYVRSWGLDNHKFVVNAHGAWRNRNRVEGSLFVTLPHR